MKTNKSQLIDALSARFEGNRKAAAHALESVLDTITREVAKGNKVAITGFGSFEKRVRNARMVRNPRTGEQIQAKKTAVPKFTAGADLKNVVSGAKKLPKLTVAAASPAAKKATATAKKATSAAKKTAKKAAKKAGSPRSDGEEEQRREEVDGEEVDRQEVDRQEGGEEDSQEEPGEEVHRQEEQRCQEVDRQEVDRQEEPGQEVDRQEVDGEEVDRQAVTGQEVHGQEVDCQEDRAEALTGT